MANDPASGLPRRGGVLIGSCRRTGEPLISLKSHIQRGRKLSRLIRHGSYRRGLRHGIGAAIEHESVIRRLPIDTLVDVGANVGQFTLLCKAWHPAAKVHAFEPLENMADKYAALFAGDTSVTLHRLAAGQASAVLEINVSGRPDSSSLLAISDLQGEIFPGTEKSSSHMVKVEPVDAVLDLDGLVGNVLVKLDVQGYELAALQGMPRILERARWAYVEVSYKELYEGQPLAGEIVAWLHANGYRLSGVFNSTLLPGGEAVQSDMLFTNIRKAS